MLRLAREVDLLAADAARELAARRATASCCRWPSTPTRSRPGCCRRCRALGDEVLLDLRRADQDDTAALLRDGTVRRRGDGGRTSGAGLHVHAARRAALPPGGGPGLRAAVVPRRADGRRPSAARPVVDYDRDDDLQRGWLRRRTRGRADPPAHHVPSTEGFVQAVLAGLGWGMLSELQLADPALRDAVVLLDPDAVVDVRLHWQRWKVRSPSLERLTEVVLTGGRAALRPGDGRRCQGLGWAVDGTVLLRFTSASRELETHTDLSAVRSDGPVLWVAGDETATVERLVAEDGGWGGQESFALADLVDLPGGADEEADVEGLARDGGFLWAVGSHSLRRKRVANRQVLLRLPLEAVDGLPRAGPRGRGRRPVQRAASFGSRGKDLRDLLADDERLAPFLPIPGTDHGLDVEGIAVRGDRVLLGLRGPVLRGWAVVLEVRPYVDEDEPDRLRLHELDLPYGEGCDHAEGIGLLDDGRLLVVDDSRLRGTAAGRCGPGGRRAAGLSRRRGGRQPGPARQCAGWTEHDASMPRIRRLDHVGITVTDLDTATAFFVQLGLEVEGRTSLEGDCPRHGRSASRTRAPRSSCSGRPTEAPVSSWRASSGRTTKPGHPPRWPPSWGCAAWRSRWQDLHALLERLAVDGFGLVGGVGEHEHTWRMASVRGPEGIIVSLAERIG